MVKCEISGNGRKENSLAYGIRVFNHGRLLVHKCRIYGNVRGIWIDEGPFGIPAKRAVITDCEIYDNKYEGIVVGGNKGFSHNFTNVIIRRNRIYITMARLASARLLISIAFYSKAIPFTSTTTLVVFIKTMRYVTTKWEVLRSGTKLQKSHPV